jgi:hypothetical protein
MNQATFQIDKPSDVKTLQSIVNTEIVNTEKVTQEKVTQEKVTQEKVKIAEVVKNTDITTAIAPIKKPIQKVENIYYL